MLSQNTIATAFAIGILGCSDLLAGKIVRSSHAARTFFVAPEFNTADSDPESIDTDCSDVIRANRFDISVGISVLCGRDHLGIL